MRKLLRTYWVKQIDWQNICLFLFENYLILNQNHLCDNCQKVLTLNLGIAKHEI
jgi:hypothetical protein